ncbi:MAG: outer membrane lipoprotein carrier protein LolA [Bacteroidaceae bacterium]|nr:outer membrane lipoprotein carrier protein LolA [Bacteroidaceae bacterium]
MRKYIYILIMCLAPVVASAQNQAAIIEKINKISAEMKTMECDFVQTKHLKMLNDKMVSNGKMYYQQTNKLRWEYVTPYAYTFILNDNKVMLKNQKRTDVIDVNQNKMFKEIARMMMNSIVGKCLSDEKAFKTTIKETPNEWVATLIPQKKDMKQMWTKLILHFDRTKNIVAQVEMHEKTGDYTVIDLKNTKTNKTIDQKQFSVN